MLGTGRGLALLLAVIEDFGWAKLMRCWVKPLMEDDAKCLPGKRDVRNRVKIQVGGGVQSDGKRITETLKESCPGQ